MSNTKSPKRDALLSMSNAIKRLMQLLRQDQRYKLDAYIFVESGLSYAQRHLGMGSGPPLEPGRRKRKPATDATEEPSPVPRHVTGQELCEALRLYALEQFGLMAKLVLGSWGVHATSDFGEIVFNLIRVGRLRKSASDCREDFDGVYEFDEAFCRRFEIRIPVADSEDEG